MNSFHRNVKLKILLATGVFGALMLAGCAGAPSMISSASDNARMTTNLFLFLFVVAVIVFVVVEFFLFYSVIRFRRKKTDEMPEQIHGNTKLELAWTTAPAIVLAIVFVLTWQTLSALAAVPKDAVKIKVTGHQWWWEVEYTDLGVITANEIHMPAGKAAAFTLESADVIHSFWVPELAGKMDLIPGHTNRMWIRPQLALTFHGQCAEFCGTSHANMRFSVIVDPPDKFDEWITQQKLPAATPVSDQAKQGAGVIAQAGCAACHSINGTAAQGKVGPNLTHLASRRQIAAGLLDLNGDNLRTWIGDPQAVKPGATMPKLPLSKDQLDALVAYLTTLK